MSKSALIFVILGIGTRKASSPVRTVMSSAVMAAVGKHKQPL